MFLIESDARGNRLRSLETGVDRKSGRSIFFNFRLAGYFKLKCDSSFHSEFNLSIAIALHCKL